MKWISSGCNRKRCFWDIHYERTCMHLPPLLDCIPTFLWKKAWRLRGKLLRRGRIKKCQLNSWSDCLSLYWNTTFSNHGDGSFPIRMIYIIMLWWNFGSSQYFSPTVVTMLKVVRQMLCLINFPGTSHLTPLNMKRLSLWSLVLMPRYCNSRMWNISTLNLWFSYLSGVLFHSPNIAYKTK